MRFSYVNVLLKTLASTRSSPSSHLKQSSISVTKLAGPQPSSVHHYPGKQPSCHSSSLLRYIRSLDWAQILSLISAAASTTPLQDLPSPPPLLLLLDVPCPDLQSLILCRLARVHQEDCSSSTRKSTHSQDRACKCTFDIQSEVTSPLKNVLANVLVTFTHKSASPLKNVLAKALTTLTRKSTHSQDRACKCTVTSL